MQIERLSIPEVLIITPQKFADNRGWFSESWNAGKLAAQGFNESFMQDNHSYSAAAGTIRGLHCQVAPSVQGKLVRVVRGAIWDVAVDIRTGSPTYGKWAAAEISAENGRQIWVPGGFLHGFCTLQPDTEVIYKVTAPYDKAAERAVIWNDPALALPWPVKPGEAALSDKDRAAPAFNADANWFVYK